MPEALRAGWRSLQLLARPRAPEALPARLDRRRIYVLPTGFGLFVALLLAVMLLGALNYNNNPALLLALLLGAAGIASTINAHLQLSGLRLEAVSAEPVPAGSPLKLRLTLARGDNRSRRGLQVAHPGAEPVFAGLAQDDRTEVDLWLPTTQRGWLDLQRIRLSTTQPLGLARAWGWLWPEAPLLVYPQPESAGPPLPESDGAPARTRAHPLGEELQQLRGYRAGDAPRTISWKHSARRDTLLVREHERPLGVEVVLDWRTLANLPYERRIARLARWVNEAEREGRRYRLNLPGNPVLGPGNGDAHRHLCLRALALLPHG
ncbi:DUF58 domain-containing protein [Flavobacterium sp. MXW15]|uniref:DUF58 domain-containing protein n=1 Tax=Xanthomonas chitinilytica TaxID=2989819 RepID=A0ABT3JUD1_9XANT|nr:DUF58 domain-containing protein [Xanthomonas sp. H13-6]MCW4453546.1 DUF58 domain-containing protein [Flavobacterium sp. MXW15]MCW4472101.1 DUF58 domain-containing protein [Xanthomonas sp. H13-6]